MEQDHTPTAGFPPWYVLREGPEICPDMGWMAGVVHKRCPGWIGGGSLILGDTGSVLWAATSSGGDCGYPK